MDETNKTQDTQEEKSQWQKTKEGWYDKVPLTVKQLDFIIWGASIALAIVFIKIFLDAGIF